MTLAQAKLVVSQLGLTLVKIDGEYIVKPRGAKNDDARTYFTNNLDDAVATAARIAKGE